VQRAALQYAPRAEMRQRRRARGREGERGGEGERPGGILYYSRRVEIPLRTIGTENCRKRARTEREETEKRDGNGLESTPRTLIGQRMREGTRGAPVSTISTAELSSRLVKWVKTRATAPFKLPSARCDTQSHPSPGERESPRRWGRGPLSLRTRIRGAAASLPR